MVQPFLDHLPTLDTNRLILRRSTVADAAAYAEMIRANGEGARFLQQGRSLSLEEAQSKLRDIDRRFTEDNSAVPWTLTLRGHDELIGFVGFVRWNKNDFRSEVAYGLHPAQHGQGFATEALARVLSFGFSEMQLHRAEAHIDPDNTRSIRLAERVGFTREGLLREHSFYNGVFSDTVIYAQLKS